MQKKLLVQLMTALLVSAGLSAAPNASENFNSRKGTTLQQVRARLQNTCWTFHHFDINQQGWDPKIEGDGAMVSEQGATQFNNAGIYTPLLNVSTQFDVSFDYKFSENFSADTKRWIKICLADAQNQIVQVLEEVKISGAEASRMKNYSTEFKNIMPGEYRLVLLYGGSGGNANIAIDDLNTSATLRYEGGCNLAPAAPKEKVTGTDKRTAAGSLFENNGSNKSLKTFLVKGSSDGKVELQADGTFRFTPKAGFKGRSTSFVYRVCNESGANLCSPPTTLRINFPTGTSQLVDFKGSYKFDGNVELAWNTEAGSTFDKFEVERSLDGNSWQSTGIIQAKQIDNDNNYTYIDNMSKNTVLKKDLYYRLRQVEEDGTVSLSRMMIVRVYNTRTVTMISVTPNPLKKDIAVNLQLQQSSYVSMRMRDNSGATVIKKIVEADKGLNNLLIEGSSSLVPGLYQLELIVNSKERMLVKLLKE